MSYVVNSTDGVFKITEKTSSLVVAKYKSNNEATNVCRSLNLGSGFDGWTPPFFALEYPVQKEKPLNE